MKRHIISVATLLLVFVVVGRGQDTNSHSVPVPAISGELPYTTLLTPPLPVSSLRRPLTFASESERSNYITGRLQLGAGYDDNLLAQPRNHLDEVSYIIMPSIQIVKTRERWNWEFGYSPGFIINQKLVQNETAHDLDMVFDYRLSPHVTTRLYDAFRKSNTLFYGFLQGSAGPEPGPLQQPNTSVVMPFANRAENNSGLDLTYQFSASDLVGASGNFNFVNYDADENLVSSNSGLIDSRAWGGDAFYTHRFSNRHWAGFTYSFQRLQFDPGYRTDVSRTFLFYSIETGSHLTFSVWAGPEQTTSVLPSVLSSANETDLQVHWGVAGGADLTWQGKRTITRLGYTRQTTDGSGIAQAVNLEQINGEIWQRLTARLTGGIGVGYAKNNPLNAANGLVPSHSWLGNAQVEYRLTDNLVFALQYGRDQLSYIYSPSPAVRSNRNRAWVSLSYSFSRPLGR